ncbi:Gir2p [Ascoidea rubescens DSM 1968]|uniref:RWD-domain-containing protein n=1 Tax=Ascoidea rubescens DSM 1968 TaxID=1344418 RepID=A0A1D2VEZ6_9ASCO|nr:RWD-domain-containing protein [Ascoidea rubescens DSM 1968]ODV60206.1 RWD-domain-containing protein [Ascoidea rubescens DSM 1968]
MDPIEEQKEELEILQSIYPDELSIASDTDFTIDLLLETPSEKKHLLVLHVHYTPKYPNELPDLDDSEDDSDDDGDIDGSGATRKPVIISELVQFDSSDLKSLLNKLYDEANENLGMPLVFTLTSYLKETAESLFQDKLKIEEKKHEKQQYERELEENKKFMGTKITKENFQAWRLDFRKRMNLDRREQKRLDLLHRDKLTGKQFFQNNLNTINLNDLNENISSLTVN